MAIKVLITDDHGVVRQGLRMFLTRDSELQIVGEAANGKEALHAVHSGFVSLQELGEESW